VPGKEKKEGISQSSQRTQKKGLEMSSKKLINLCDLCGLCEKYFFGCGFATSAKTFSIDSGSRKRKKVPPGKEFSAYLARPVPAWYLLFMEYMNAKISATTR
jgi:hypothetical protein